MKQPELFQVDETALPRRQLAIHGRVEAGEFPTQSAERPHQRHVADHVHHLPVHGGGFVGEGVVQRFARGGEAEHHDDSHAGDGN